MNKRFLSVILFAVVVSGIATFAIYKTIVSRLTVNAARPVTRLVAASHDLALGSLIKEGDISQIEWTGAVPPQVVMKKEDAVGRGVTAPIYANEPILETRLAPKGAGGGLASIIPPGMRAVAIRVNDIVGVAGFVSPGTHVDILISGNPPGQGGQTGTLTKTLLQNIEVLSAGQNIQKDAEGKPVQVAVVNLLVTPEQAETLSLASNETRIQLVLRNPLDDKQVAPPGTFLAGLFTGSKPPAPATSSAPRRPPAPKPAPAPEVKPPEKVAVVPIVIEVLNGSRLSELKFQRETEEKQP
jgi:pilus assembly protein CpaB